jgi:hypothetical protein
MKAIVLQDELDRCVELWVELLEDAELMLIIRDVFLIL